MRSAAPTLWSSPFVFKARVVALLGALAVPVSCSVYTNDLLDGASAGFTQSGAGGGATGAAGNGNGSGSGTNGGKSGGAQGGAPDEMEQGGYGGEDPVVVPSGGSGGTSTAGAPGTAGTAGTGVIGGGAGTAGTGGSTTTTGELLDGFEDNDLTLEQTSGRGGVWYPFNDGTKDGKAGPVPFAPSALTGAPEALGAFAMHVTASGFVVYGSGLGVDFKAGKKLYDISKFQGIRFWARVGASKNTRHRVQIPELRTDKLGGKCDPSAAAVDGKKCDDHFGMNKTFTTTWTQYSILFTDMTQAGFGFPGGEDTKLDTANTYGLQITAKQNLDVDLWVDEFEFF